MKVGIVGGGSWGVSLANVLNDNGHDVGVYFRDKLQVEYINTNGKSCKYLRDFVFPKKLELSCDIMSVIEAVDVIILSTPLQAVVETAEMIRPYVNASQLIVNVSKGIHFKTLKLANEIIRDYFPENKYVVLSGPSHAEEVSKRMATSLVSASESIDDAKVIQDLFMNDYFRVYIHSDVVGVELAGALKNVIAIGAGALNGLKQGDNAKAALITRGLFEIVKLAKHIGCDTKTFMGLAGMGDLIVTATSVHSRNYRAGVLFGQGKSLNEVRELIGETVEGINTAQSVYALSKKYNVEMPISSAIYKVIFEDLDPEEAIMSLMTRSRKHEFLEIVEL